MDHQWEKGKGWYFSLGLISADMFRLIRMDLGFLLPVFNFPFSSCIPFLLPYLPLFVSSCPFFYRCRPKYD